jgi:prepilin-type N-terminal cleavage/methylation domain-containing protein
MARSRSAQSDPGLTLIECLVAIVVISITVVAITPPIFVATASRIQSRRAEQANEIAQAEVDRVRVVMERVPATETQLPAVGTDVASGVNPSVLASPGDGCPTSKYPSSTQASATQVIPVDVDGDGDCTPEFAMQVVRANDCFPPVPPGGTAVTVPYSFDLTVRVYGYKSGDAMSNLGAKRMTLGLTTGRAGDDPTTGALRKPLQVLTTRVSRVGKADSVVCVVRTPPP